MIEPRCQKVATSRPLGTSLEVLINYYVQYLDSFKTLCAKQNSNSNSLTYLTGEWTITYLTGDSLCLCMRSQISVNCASISFIVAGVLEFCRVASASVGVGVQSTTSSFNSTRCRL